jgi:hypothetical protein
MNFRLLTYYVDPNEQVSQLRALGFEGITTIGQDGEEVKSDRLSRNQDSWIYYMCQAS